MENMLQFMIENLKVSKKKSDAHFRSCIDLGITSVPCTVTLLSYIYTACYTPQRKNLDETLMKKMY